MPKPAFLLIPILACFLSVGVVAAQDPEPADTEEQELPEADEVVVVTASRTEQPLDTVPAAMTVLDSATLEQTPADDYGDYLRNVPGLNVSQMSARDIQITGRSATNSLATSSLVLLDNRSLYLDFFGFVMWDFAPIDPREIKQIEVVRGPGSAVWGANAMTGVINMITKSPKEMPGTTVVLGGGELGTASAAITHAGTSGKIGYKISGSYYEQDPYERPSGTIPGTAGPTNPGGTQYPAFQNQGTEQPKLNVRIDYDQNDETTWSFSGGIAETDGIMHSGIGPFDIDSNTSLSYFKADWQRRAARVTFFANVLDGDATNLLTVGLNGLPLNFIFDSETYNLDFSNTTVLGTHHVLTYGATARRNEFDLSIAPLGDQRDEFGVFFQDEILFGDRVRWLVGARWDDIDPIKSVVSPRTSLLFKVREDHTLRFSFNRAFRAPSMVNNFLDTTIFNQVAVQDPALAMFGVQPFGINFSTDAVGNVNLEEERLDALEVGYVGSFGPHQFTASIYRNETTDSIDFFQSAVYPAVPPSPADAVAMLSTDLIVEAMPGVFVTICAAGTLLQNCALPPPLAPATLYDLTRSSLPAAFSYRNIGEIVDQGVELSLHLRPAEHWTVDLNYSWQDEPDVTGIPQETLPNGTVRDAVNTPPENRANVGVSWTGERFFVSGNVNYNDDAFWTDVLDSRFWGPTDSFTMVNLSAGVNLSDNVTLSVQAQNVTDEDVMQHVFGDLISRKVIGQLFLRF